MRSVVQQLNRGLLLSRRVHGGPPPYMYRKALRSLLTLSLNPRGVLSDTVVDKLESALQAMLDIDRRDLIGAIGILEELADNVSSQSGDQIPQAEADALLAAIGQMMMFARCQYV